MATIPIPGVNTPTYQSWAKLVADELNLRACVVGRSTNFAAVGLIPWDSAIYDPDGSWSAANPTRLTVKHAGLYVCGIQATKQNGTGTQTQINWNLNGSNISIALHPAPAAGDHYFNYECVPVVCTVGQYFEMYNQFGTLMVPGGGLNPFKAWIKRISV